MAIHMARLSAFGWVLMAGVAAVSATMSVSRVSAAHQAATVLAAVPITGPMGRVAANSETARVYVTHAGNQLTLIDGMSNGVVKTITLGSCRLQGIALNPITDRVYIADVCGTIFVLDGELTTTVAAISLSRPEELVMDTVTNRLYSPDRGAETVRAIDGASNTIVGSVAAGSGVHGVAVNPDTGLVYLASYNTGRVEIIDGPTMTLLASVPAGGAPASVAVSSATGRLYVANSTGDTLTILDGEIGTFIAIRDLCPGRSQCAPWWVAVNPVTEHVYTAILDGTVSILDEDARHERGHRRIAVGASASYVAVNTTLDRVYSATFDSISVIGNPARH